MQDIEEFIKSYSEVSAEKICFAWNGKHSDELEDANYDFRNEVAQKLLGGKVLGSGELIRDILLAEALLSKEIWGETGILTDLGTLLLTQTKAEFIDSFFEAKGLSFDTECALTCYEVPINTLEEIIEDLNSMVNSGASIENIEYYKGYFSDYLERK